MLVHSVYFWLRPELAAEQVEKFQAALESLKAIDCVSQCFIGKPAGVTARPVVDLSFSYSITAIFNSVAQHDEYQIHPIHKRFLEENKPLWSRVQIYDSE